MKSTLIALLFLLVLTASDCNKEGPNCHHAFQLVNLSSDTIIWGTKGFFGTTGKCNLAGDTLLPDNSADFRLIKSCWEIELSNGRTQDIYVIDPSHYNDPGKYYDCDSIEFKNTVLKKYELTIEDLKASDFTITYP